MWVRSDGLDRIDWFDGLDGFDELGWLDGLKGLEGLSEWGYHLMCTALGKVSIWFESITASTYPT